MRLIRPVLGLAFAAAAAASAHAQYAPAGGGTPSSSALRVVTPTRGDVHRFVTQPGTVRPSQQATLYAKVPGYLKSIAVDKGDSVKTGSPLAEIEMPELVADLAKARADLAKAEADAAKARADAAKTAADVGKANAELTRMRADIPRAKAELDLAALDQRRTEDANKKAPDLVVPQQVDTAKARHDQAIASHAAAQAAAAAAQATVSAAQALQNAAVLAADAQVAAVAAAKANMARYETMLGFTRITAPFEGIVTARLVDPGAFIPAATGGSPAQTAALLVLMDFRTVRVQVMLPETEAPLASPGQPVRVSVEGLPGRTFEGTVTRHSYALDEATRTMLVEAELPNPKLELRPGMYAIVRVGVQKHANVMLVPSDALVMERATSFVFLNEGGKARKTPVKIGFNDGVNVEIVSGLAESAKVITAGKTVLVDGQPVNTGAGK
ncbi:MAG: efflux RND transporter periplasmic adaptor subunit [Verrucomicrobia bacterium]|nr:efflux RND transporter periplasmic adaptor subunit [Verrucomicrobiota bacterium]